MRPSRRASPQPAQTAAFSAERALVRALQAGDEHTLERLFAAHHGSMIELIRAFVPEPEHAERVALEVWSELCDARASGQGAWTLRVWLLRSAARRARAWSAGQPACDPAHEGQRPARRTSSRFREDGEWREPPQRWSADALASPEARGTLVRTLQNLPSAERATVLLRDMQGLALMDVAAILGLPETDVRRLLCAGRNALHGALQNLLDAEQPRVPC